MINLFQLKKQAKEQERDGDAASASVIRAQKDHNELELAPTCKLEFPDPDDLMNFNLYITPDEGIYRQARFKFTIKIGRNYPYEAPKVHCEHKVYHPNLDLEGNVCLNILREDWKPVLSLQSVIDGLSILLLEPNPSDPLNKEAAKAVQAALSK